MYAEKSLEKNKSLNMQWLLTKILSASCSNKFFLKILIFHTSIDRFRLWLKNIRKVLVQDQRESLKSLVIATVVDVVTYSTSVEPPWNHKPRQRLKTGFNSWRLRKKKHLHSNLISKRKNWEVPPLLKQGLDRKKAKKRCLLSIKRK